MSQFVSNLPLLHAWTMGASGLYICKQLEQLAIIQHFLLRKAQQYPMAKVIVRDHTKVGVFYYKNWNRVNVDIRTAMSHCESAAVNIL